MTIGFPKPRPKVLDQQDECREDLSLKRLVYDDVDRRDGKRCRCCGRRGNPYATAALGRIHRAHIVDASRGGERILKNLCSLCWICHALEHAKQLFFVGTDASLQADPPLTFEIHEAAVVEVFGSRTLPSHVRIVTGPRHAL